MRAKTHYVAFDYLTVLAAVITGLAMTNIVAGWARLVHGRGEGPFYWPSFLWSAVIFAACVQHWWAQYSNHMLRTWTFAGFFAMLLIPLDLYMLSELVLPRREGFDAEAWFVRNRRWFFGFVFLIAILAYVEQYAITGVFEKRWLENALLGVLAIIALAGWSRPFERMQLLLSICGIVLTVAYIALLFNALPG